MHINSEIVIRTPECKIAADVCGLYTYQKSCEVSYMGIKVMHVHTVALLIMNSINA